MRGLKQAFAAMSVVLLGVLAPSAIWAESEGHWRLVGVETTTAEPREPGEGLRRSFTISPGQASHEMQGGGYDSDYLAQAQWDAPPAILIPGQEMTLGLSLHLARWQYSGFELGLHTGVFITAARPFAEAEHVTDRSQYWFHWSDGSVAYAAVGTRGRPRAASDSSSFDPPPGDSEGGRNYFGIMVGEDNNYDPRLFYIYAWHPGPPDADAEPPVVPGSDATAPPPIAAIPDTTPPDDADEPERVRTNQVSYLRGRVQANIDGVWMDAHVGMILPGDSVLRTLEGSAAQVFLFTGDVVHLRPGSTLEVPHPVPRIEEQGSVLRVILGKIWMNIRSGGNREVHTTSVIAGATGTDFSITVGEDGSEHIHLYSGALDIRPAAGSAHPPPEVTLRPGHGLWLQDGQWHGPAPLSAVQRAEGLVMARDGYGQELLHPAETEGALIDDRSAGDWRHALHAAPGGRHGILYFDALPLPDIGDGRLDTPFGPMVWHGAFSPDATASTGWQVATDAPAAPPQAGAPLPPAVATPTPLPDPGLPPMLLLTIDAQERLGPDMLLLRARLTNLSGAAVAGVMAQARPEVIPPAGGGVGLAFAEGAQDFEPGEARALNLVATGDIGAVLVDILVQGAVVASYRFAVDHGAPAPAPAPAPPPAPAPAPAPPPAPAPAPAPTPPQAEAAPGDVGDEVQMMVLATPQGRGSPLHAGPGAHHPVLLQAEEGDWIELQSTQGDWALVWHLDSDTEGWLPRALLDLGAEPGAPPMLVIQTTGPGWVALRPTPDEGHEPIARLFSGMMVDLIERGDGWLQVMLADGTTGWILEGSSQPFP